MSRYISKLPPEIRELAEKRRSEQMFPKEIDILVRAFNWFITPEGIEFWREINKENYSVFYSPYPQKDKLDELIDWMVKEASNFEGQRTQYLDGIYDAFWGCINKAKEIKDGK